MADAGESFLNRRVLDDENEAEEAEEETSLKNKSKFWTTETPVGIL